MATSPRAIPVKTRVRTLRQMVVAADADFIQEGENPIEYEFSETIFRGRYKLRGPYAGSA